MTKFRTPTNIKILVSDDGRRWEEAKHSGSVPGTLSLISAAEIKYLKLEMVEDMEAADYNLKPLGIKQVEIYGCPTEDTIAECGIHETKVSTNSTAYRHIG